MRQHSLVEPMGAKKNTSVSQWSLCSFQFFSIQLKAGAIRWLRPRSPGNQTLDLGKRSIHGFGRVPGGQIRELRGIDLQEQDNSILS
jgi:hypothetical protein